MARCKKTTLEQTVAAIRRQHGPTALMKASRAESEIPVLPTGFRSLDAALGIGGLPRGQITEFIGPLTTGKTTMAALLVAQAQRLGDDVAYLDLGGTVDPDYLVRCGANLQRLPIIRPYHCQQALEIALKLVARGSPGLLVLDAVDDLWREPLDPRWASSTLRQLLGRLHRSSCVLLALHHSHEGKVEYPPGFSLNENAWLRLQLENVRWIRRWGDVRGYKADVRILRHRGGREGKRACIRITFNGTVHAGRL